MSYSGNLDDLGDAIESIIDRAVRSQDFQNLNQAISDCVNAAVDTGSEAVRRAVGAATRKEAANRKVVNARTDDPLYVPGTRPVKGDEQANVNIYSSTLGSTRASRAQRDAQKPVLYSKSSSKRAKGILKTVGGGIMTFFGAGGILTDGLLAILTGGFSVVSGLALAVVGGGVYLITSGIRSIKRANRFERYIKLLGDKTQCQLSQLAQMVGKSPQFVRKELKGMIDEGLFLEGHLDEEEDELITSDDSYIRYLEEKRKQAIQKQQQVVQTKKKQDAADRKKLDAQVQEVLDKGNAFIEEIRKCNDAIPGEEISTKISRIETLVRRIFERAEEHPEVVPELKKLMNYYLPMTVKLLRAYADMDAQPIQGENIRASKQEIEQTLDTLNTAFEKLLDSIFKTTTLDVSSDISVLNTLLAQEGLTEDALTRLRREAAEENTQK